MSFPELPTIKKRLPPRQLASFPAIGPLGLVTRLWLWWLRRHMNRARYQLTMQYRKPKRGTPRRFRADVSRKWASRVGLYVNDKMESKLNEYSRAIGRHDERRHLAAERKAGEEMARLLTAERGLVKAHESAQLHLHGELDKARSSLEVTRDKLAAVQLTATRDQIKANDDAAALARIHALLDVEGEDWDAETIELVAGVIIGLGYEIRDPNDPAKLDHEPVARPWGPMKGGQ